MARVQNAYGGRKTYQRTRSPENFWTPPKDAFKVRLSRGFLYRKNRATTPEGVENCHRTRGGSKTPFISREGCHSHEVFAPPSFFHPPHGLSSEGRLYQRRLNRLKSPISSGVSELFPGGSGDDACQGRLAPSFGTLILFAACHLKRPSSDTFHIARYF